MNRPSQPPGYGRPKDPSDLNRAIAVDRDPSPMDHLLANFQAQSGVLEATCARLYNAIARLGGDWPLHGPEPDRAETPQPAGTLHALERAVTRYGALNADAANLADRLEALV